MKDDQERNHPTFALIGGASLSGLVVLLTLLPAVPLAQEEARAPSLAPARLGQLEGQVTVGPRLNARKLRFTLYPDLSGVAPSPSAAAGEEVKNVVLYLDSPALERAALRPPEGTFRMEQRSESFVPHVLPVPRGSTVDFPNTDPLYHNVFSLSKAAAFDLGRYPRGNSRSVRFNEPGVVRVFCHIHADMSAVILVLDNPYFASPDAGGRFRFLDLPPGNYTITAWHERARPVRRKISIEPGKTAVIDFAIPLEDAALSE
ncbi:MAG: hypothetical protein DMH00_12870 [Acidobacteria bacterium]|nr:MAG: hypothetical protein DMH00_12870 [Acidobacteriota bacterium]